MSKIDDKYAELKANGFDLGAPLAPEQDEAAGGRVRRYENGNIYWDSATGAHEVHGGILALYLDNGGPGDSRYTGGRELGYPISDELTCLGVPQSKFETGAIYWMPGTGGCLIAHSIWEVVSKQYPGLGLPLIGNTVFAGGLVAYFERGVIFSTASQAPGVTSVVVGTLQPPLMGNPVIVDPADQNTRRFSSMALWRNLDRKQYEALIAWRPTIFSDLWNERLAISAVGSTDEIPLTCSKVEVTSETIGSVDLAATFELLPGGPNDLQDRTLYDLRLKTPHGSYNLSPHCLYTKHDWDHFGLFHITDLHINQRNENMRTRLQQLGLSTAANNLCNFQDNLRAFITYANHLYSRGEADAVVATGDLIDYVAEANESSYDGNFARLRRLLLGEPLDPGGQPGDELKIPIFTTFGNHDYRLYPYNLVFDINVPLKGTSHLDEYESFNILQSDAIALEGGKTPTYDLTSIKTAAQMLEYDRSKKGESYSYFTKFFTDKRQFVVRLGKHRLVLMDTKYDNGVPDLGSNLNLIADFITGNTGTNKLIEGGAPDSFGFQDASDFNDLKEAITEAGDDGLVIVGMHAPSLSPIGGEYPYYMRETILPSGDPGLVDAFIQKNKLAGSSWTPSGAGFFKTGDITDGMDSGVLAYGGLELLKIFAGVDQPRPVDLVLWGHHHDRVEYRVRWNGAALEYYMDFYTEAPTTYYHTYNYREIVGSHPIPIGAPIAVIIDSNAQPNAPIMATTLNTLPGAPLTFGQVKTPPYPNPLNASQDPKQWWIDHRPLLAQTSALGPSDPRQRFGTFWEVRPTDSDDPQDVETVELDGAPASPDRSVSVKEQPARLPQPLFSGCRFIQVNGGVITQIQYLTTRQIHNADILWSAPSIGGGRRVPREAVAPRPVPELAKSRTR